MRTAPPQNAWYTPRRDRAAVVDDDNSPEHAEGNGYIEEPSPSTVMATPRIVQSEPPAPIARKAADHDPKLTSLSNVYGGEAGRMLGSLQGLTRRRKEASGEERVGSTPPLRAATMAAPKVCACVPTSLLLQREKRLPTVCASQ